MPTAVAPPPGITAKGIEIFKAGLRRDSDKREKTWTQAELDEICDAYNSVAGNLHDAPAISDPGAIVVGHDGKISYGWLERAYRDGNTLLGDYRDVDPKFAEGVNIGHFRKRSISLYPRTDPDNPTPGRWNIRHVAYVHVPAVKGMKDHTFSEGEEEESFVEFSEVKPPADAKPEAQTTPSNFEGSAGIGAIAQVFQAQRDRLIEAKGLEEAEKVFPSFLMETLQAAGRETYLTSDDLQRLREMHDALLQQVMELRDRCPEKPEPLAQPNYTEAEQPVTTEPTPSTSQPAAPDATAALIAELQTLRTEFSEFKAGAESERTAFQKEIEGLKIVNSIQSVNAERERVSNFVEGLVRDRKVKPTEKDKKIKLLLSASDETTVNFGEGDDEAVSLRQALMDDMAAGEELWSDSPLPTGKNQAPKGSNGSSSTANFSAPDGFTVDADSARQHEMAVNYCETQGWNWKDSAKYTAALIATLDA